jgi:hypothetical protein
VMRYQLCETELAEAISEPEIDVCRVEVDWAESVEAARRNTDKSVNGTFDTTDIGMSPLDRQISNES